MTKTVQAVFQQPGFGPPTPVTIFQWATEYEELLELYRERAPMNVLEIGTFHGGTLYHWLLNAAKGATITSLDSYVAGVDNRHLYDGWVPDGVTLNVIAGDSREPATHEQAKALGPLDWLFIDGGHYYAEAKADWELYRPLVQEGGVVVFHDIVTNPDWPWIEVEKLWREIQEAGFVTREIIHEKPDPVCGLGVVYL